MEAPLTAQLAEIALALALGLSCGFVYDILRAFRRRSTRSAMTPLLDALYWVICTAALFTLGLATGGEQRIFLAVFALLGTAAYLAVVSPAVFRFTFLVTDALFFIAHTVTFPVRFAVKMLKKYGALAKKHFISAAKWYKMRRNEKKRTAAEGGIVYEVQTRRYSYGDNNRGADNLRGSLANKSARSDL